MAWQTNNASGGPYRSSAAFAASALTVFFRFKRQGNGGTAADFYSIIYDSGFTNFVLVEGDTSNTYLRVLCSGGTSHATISGSLTNDVWYDVAAVISNTGAGNAKIYLGTTGSSWSSATGDGPSTAFTTQIFRLGFEDANYWPQATFDDYRVWDAALTEQELLVERARRAPSRTANLYFWLPMIYGSSADNVKDRSGNARNFTAGTTPTMVDGAPAPWGAPLFFHPIANAATGVPTLSLPGVQGITATSATPKVTLTY